ncbi:hypothetical protein PSTG_11386 [Puccinia striiformis f. sp. tritici PST-78]|uniref:Uncharacterized protein n=1 Tax=Puccinia striiformis f. sp. tritici PST-78 TaxID=1165861 RepID=A0A0L0V7P5_9BASI|nr:hypothetical protein PSTG_11386 [Puccinia striiformis f. sp. tritici PST-78]
MKLHCAVIARDLRSSSSTLRWEIAPVAELTALLGYGNHVDNSSNANRTHPLKLKLQLHSFNSPPPTKQKHLRTTNMLFTTQIVALTLAFAAHTGASTPKLAHAAGDIASPTASTTGTSPANITQVSPAHANITDVTPAHADTAEVTPVHADTAEVTPAHADTAEVTPAANATTSVPPTTPNVTAVVPTGSSLPSHDSVSLPVPAGRPVHGDMSSGKCMCPPPPTCVSFVDPKFAADVVSPISSGITPPITNSTVDDDTPLGNNTEGNSTSTGTPSVLNSFSLAGFMAAGAVALAL